MQGCTIKSLQGCMHLARDDRKVVCTLQRLIQGCHKLAATFQGCNDLAARLPQPRNFHMGKYVTGFAKTNLIVTIIEIYFIA